MFDHKHDKLEKGKLESMWNSPYAVNKFLEKAVYELVDYDRIPFGKHRNGLYLKMYYSYNILHQYRMHVCIFDFLLWFYYFSMVLVFLELLITCYVLNFAYDSLLWFYQWC